MPANDSEPGGLLVCLCIMLQIYRSTYNSIMLLWKYFVRMVREENIYGMQFQLKSENTDLTILKKFGGLK